MVCIGVAEIDREILRRIDVRRIVSISQLSSYLYRSVCTPFFYYSIFCERYTDDAFDGRRDYKVLLLLLAKYRAREIAEYGLMENFTSLFRWAMQRIRPSGHSSLYDYYSVISESIDKGHRDLICAYFDNRIGDWWQERMGGTLSGEMLSDLNNANHWPAISSFAAKIVRNGSLETLDLFLSYQTRSEGTKRYGRRMLASLVDVSLLCAAMEAKQNSIEIINYLFDLGLYDQTSASEFRWAIKRSIDLSSSYVEPLLAHIKKRLSTQGYDYVLSGVLKIAVRQHHKEWAVKIFQSISPIYYIWKGYVASYAVVGVNRELIDDVIALKNVSLNNELLVYAVLNNNLSLVCRLIENDLVDVDDLNGRYSYEIYFAGTGSKESPKSVKEDILSIAASRCYYDLLQYLLQLYGMDNPQILLEKAINGQGAEQYNTVRFLICNGAELTDDLYRHLVRDKASDRLLEFCKMTLYGW